MNYDATIRELEEKRDFYAAAISALKKIATHETAKPVSDRKPHANTGIKRSAETRARMAEAQRRRFQELARLRDSNGDGAASIVTETTEGSLQ